MSTNVNILLAQLKLYQEVKDDKLLLLSFGVYKKTLRLYINSMDKVGFGNRKLIFSTGLVPMNSRLIGNSLLDLVKSKEEFDVGFKLYGAKYENDKRVENERTLICTIHIRKAKNKNGNLVNLIQIVTGLDVKYTFVLKPTPYIEVFENGEKVTDETHLSDIWAKAFAKNFNAVLDLVPERFDETTDSVSNNIF